MNITRKTPTPDRRQLSGWIADLQPRKRHSILLEDDNGRAYILRATNNSVTLLDLDLMSHIEINPMLKMSWLEGSITLENTKL
jgi:hypothetical protein